MKFKNYITEFRTADESKSRVKKISEEKAIKLLTTKHKDSLSAYYKDNYLTRYAGRVVNNKFGYANTKTMPPRLSMNTLNYYTLIINDDPTWKAYPRRQIIGSAKGDVFGDTWYMFPENGMKIGVCKYEDIWDSFHNVSGMANEFNNFISTLLEWGTQVNNAKYDSTLKEFKRGCKVFDKRWDKEVTNAEEEKEMAVSLGTLPNVNYHKFLSHDYPQYMYDLYEAILASYSLLII